MYKRIHKKQDGRTVYLYGVEPHSYPALEEGEGAPPAKSHLRWHPIRQEWVIYAAHRQGRTFLPPPEYDPLNPTKPGGFPTDIPFEDFEIAVFENRFTSMSPRVFEPPTDLAVETALANGDCEVVVYTSAQSGNLGSLTQERRELLVKVWADRYKELYKRPQIQFVMPFENRGVEVGVTLHHPHGQIYAYPMVPPLLQREVAAFRQSAVLLNMLPKLEPYIYAHNEHAYAMVPPFARYPYETYIVPRKFHPGPWTFSDEETQGFAALMGEVVQRLDKLFDRPMPYIMAQHASPKGEEGHFHFHMEFYPALRAKDRLKYLAGTEIAAGMFAMDALPEETAKQMREIKV
jgi:UDPglucose--hexose-1-phosphate uridylyltransferase